MSTISLSSGLRQSLVNSLFVNSVNGSYTGIANSTFKNYYNANYEDLKSQFKIMKGTVPTDFSTLTAANSRSSDVLVAWNSAQFNWANVAGSTSSMNTQYAAASQAGTATWFWWYMPSDPAVDAAPIWQIVGTVGTTGTDLILNNAALVAGSTYRIYNFSFSIPENFTY